MGKKLLDVPTVRELYAEASQILGYDLLALSLDGPQNLLDRTQYCQAATVVASLAAVELLYQVMLTRAEYNGLAMFFLFGQEKPEAVEECMAVAGFSVGEVTAAIFSGAVTLRSQYIGLVPLLWQTN